MIPWCDRCGAPVEHTQLSRYALGGVVLVRAWCHGQSARATVRIDEIRTEDRATLFEAPPPAPGAKT